MKVFDAFDDYVISEPLVGDFAVAEEALNMGLNPDHPYSRMGSWMFENSSLWLKDDGVAP